MQLTNKEHTCKCSPENSEYYSSCVPICTSEQELRMKTQVNTPERNVALITSQNNWFSKLLTSS